MFHFNVIPLSGFNSILHASDVALKWLLYQRKQEWIRKVSIIISNIQALIAGRLYRFIEHLLHLKRLRIRGFVVSFDLEWCCGYLLIRIVRFLLREHILWWVIVWIEYYWIWSIQLVLQGICYLPKAWVIHLHHVLLGRLRLYLCYIFILFLLFVWIIFLLFLLFPLFLIFGLSRFNGLNRFLRLFLIFLFLYLLLNLILICS